MVELFSGANGWPGTALPVRESSQGQPSLTSMFAMSTGPSVAGRRSSGVLLRGQAGATRARLKISLVGLALIGLAFALLHLSREQEPVYQGKTLRGWLRGYCNGGDHVAISNAVLQIGTNSLPTLLGMLTKTNSTAFCKFDIWWLHHVSSQRLPDWVTYPAWHRNSAAVLNSEAHLAFRILGTNARPSLPALIQIYEDHTSMDFRQSVGMTLTAVDPTGETVLPLFLRDATNANPEVQYVAACMLSDLHYDSRVVVPALISALTAPHLGCRAMAAERLADLRAEAESAVPSLITLLGDTNRIVRYYAARALKRIDAKAAARAGVK